MKRSLYYLILLILFFTKILNASNVVTPYYSIRSQSFNAARRLVGQTDHTNLYNMPGWYFTGSLTPEYTRSIQPDDITKCLFGNLLDKNHTVRIQGSRVANRDKDALLAEYFYLPTDFQSTICFTPRIQNFLVDLNFYVGFEDWLPGLYWRLQAPITWTKWSLNMREIVNDDGTNEYEPGYFTPQTIDRNVLLNSFTDYAAGCTPGVITQFDNVNTSTREIVGIDLQALKFAKIRKNSTKTAISEIRSAFGYNFLLEPDYHLGANIQAAAPTGNRSQAKYLFETQNGNGNHWEFGIGIDGHYTFWYSQDESKSMNIHLSLDLLHLFKKRQRRTFDLCNKPLSRYMLAEKMISVVDFNLKGDGVTPSAQFKKIFTPVANITTFDVDVSIGIHADLVAMINYSSDNFSLDFGYNFYGRSCEKFDLRCCPAFEENTWALKGDSQVFGFYVDNSLTTTPVSAIPLSATNNNATINGGSNFGTCGVINQTDILAAKQNPAIDNPKNATGDPIGGSNNFTLRVNNEADVNNLTNPQIKTSVNPVFIKQTDINFVSTRAISHKIFGHFQYNWDDFIVETPVYARKHCAPYIGFGFEAEFGQNHDLYDDNKKNNKLKICKTSCNTKCNDTVQGDCVRCSLSQWGIWLKGGASFF